MTGRVCKFLILFFILSLTGVLFYRQGRTTMTNQKCWQQPRSRDCGWRTVTMIQMTPQPWSDDGSQTKELVAARWPQEHTARQQQQNSKESEPIVEKGYISFYSLFSKLACTHGRTMTKRYDCEWLTTMMIQNLPWWAKNPDRHESIY